MTHEFSYQFDNGWELSASGLMMQNNDIRNRKNQSFRAVLLGLQGQLGPLLVYLTWQTRCSGTTPSRLML